MRHRFHAICPYFAMFPESFVETWVDRVTRRGDIVLDPFCGRGTTPFQALLMGRRAIAGDINPVAFCITKAKTNAPSASAVRRRITELEKGFDGRAWESPRRRMPEFFQHAYAARPLRQLLYLRQHLKWQRSDTDCMIAALVLGALHGESEKSSSYLSNQMPRTISTKPAYSVRFWQARKLTAPERNVFDILRARTTFRYESAPPPGRGMVFHTDMRELPRALEKTPVEKPIRCAITSPPYLDVTSFEEDQWLRLWFLGGAPRPTYHVISKDDRHEKPERYWDLISDFWRVLGQVLAARGHVVIRIGGKDFDPDEMGRQLRASSIFSRRKTELVDVETSTIRKRQTDSFRPGATGCRVEADFHFRMK